MPYKLVYYAVDKTSNKLATLLNKWLKSTVAEEEFSSPIKLKKDDLERLRALGHSIYTQAETSEELKTMIQDAVKCHFEENKAPRVVRLHFVKEEVLAV